LARRGAGGDPPGALPPDPRSICAEMKLETRDAQLIRATT
jgi:hypothetical protein